MRVMTLTGSYGRNHGVMGGARVPENLRIACIVSRHKPIPFIPRSDQPTCVLFRLNLGDRSLKLEEGVVHRLVLQLNHAVL